MSMAGSAKLGFASAIFAIAGAWRSHAQAAPAPVDLVWNAPAPECPSRERVLAEVARVLGGSREPIARASARVDVAAAQDGRWQAELSVDARGAHTERRFEAESCEAIASAAALIVAVAVEESVPPEVPAAAPPPEPRASPFPKSNGSRHDSQLIVTAAGVIDDATLPAVGGGGEAGVGWAYRISIFRLRALAGASLFAEQTSSPAGYPQSGGHFTLLATSAKACGSIGSGPFELGPCLGVDVDAIWATGFGWQQTSGPMSAQWVSVLGSVITLWNFSRNIAIFARADGLIPLEQAHFEAKVIAPPLLVAYIPVHRPAPVAARGAFGIELRFF
jgi:hypothetical protein